MSHQCSFHISPLNYKTNFSCGDETHPYLAVVTCSDEESKGREPLNIHLLAVVEDQGVHYSVSSNWVVERVKKLSCCGAVM
jgi:hypothetical protein